MKKEDKIKVGYILLVDIRKIDKKIKKGKVEIKVCSFKKNETNFLFIFIKVIPVTGSRSKDIHVFFSQASSFEMWANIRQCPGRDQTGKRKSIDLNCCERLTALALRLSL